MKTEKININIKRVIFVSLMFAYFAFSMQAQVTIGSLYDPLKGALLDLKENNNETFNSTKGLILPRVSLTNVYELYPMLTGTETDYTALKPRYTGLTVYNVNQTAPFEKGIYIWDGTKWILNKPSQPISISADNGLNIPSGNNIRLGGNLLQNTTINLDNYNLIFNHNNQGKIAIGTSDNVDAVMQINKNNGADPLILRNLKFVKDTKNEIEGSNNPVYSDLRVSEKGVVRRTKPLLDPSETAITYNLNAKKNISYGSNKGSNGTFLEWTRNGTPYEFITLPEDGAYVFSFNLFCSLTPKVTQPGDANTLYISAFKEGTALSDLADIAEIVINRALDYNYASYSIILTVSGKANDKIYFKLSVLEDRPNQFDVALEAGANKVARRTSMVYWKL